VNGPTTPPTTPPQEPFLATAASDATARWMATLAAGWDRRLANIKRIAEAAER
jgi:hypothetical protein